MSTAYFSRHCSRNKRVKRVVLTKRRLSQMGNDMPWSWHLGIHSMRICARKYPGLVARFWVLQTRMVPRL